MNPRLSQTTGDFNDFIWVFSVPLGQGIGFTIPTENTVILAPRGEVDKPIEKDRLPKIAIAYFSGCPKKAVKICLVPQIEKEPNLPFGQILLIS
jgi:hypothetical protein